MIGRRDLLAHVSASRGVTLTSVTPFYVPGPRLGFLLRVYRDGEFVTMAACDPKYVARIVGVLGRTAAVRKVTRGDFRRAALCWFENLANDPD